MHSANQTGFIAIVDDDEPLRQALNSVMKAAGFVSKTFESAEEFLAAADWQDTACLILDVRLPGMSGIELQKQLSAELQRPIPIVFVTAHGDQALGDLLTKSGASFLNKPVRSDVLLREIRLALQKTKSN